MSDRQSVSGNKSRRRHMQRPVRGTGIERMGTAAKRRYLVRRLMEIEHLIETTLPRYPMSTSDMWNQAIAQTDPSQWERILDLNYLEASRQAILQSLADLNHYPDVDWSGDI